MAEGSAPSSSELRRGNRISACAALAGTPSVRVAGDLDLRGFFGVDDSVRPGFTAVQVEVTVTGPETEERYAELAAAVDEHCPVLDLFKNPVPVTRALVTSN
jgi:putative redox protein